MSSFPKHEQNIEDLANLGFDVSEYLDEDGQVTLESWGYDELVDLMAEIIKNMNKTQHPTQ